MSGGVLLIGTLAVCLLLNVPIVFSLGISCVAYMLTDGMLPFSLMAQTFVNSVDSFTLLAVPFFVLAGDIMARGGISDRLVRFCRELFFGVKGSLSLITVFASAIFAAICGSGPATVAAIGAMMVPPMEDAGYPKPFSAALTAVGGVLGPIIPPSVILIMYGVVTNKSISDLFIAGLLPGIVAAIALMIVAYFICKKHGWQQNEEKGKWSLKRVLKEAWACKWALLTPVIIIGGIYGGFFTPTEAAVVASVYAIIISLFVYREMKLKDLLSSCANTAKTMGQGILIVGTAVLFGQILNLLQLPTALGNFILGLTSNKIIILLLINIVLLVAGMFLETLAAVVIFTPLFLPMVTMLGVHPIHFGVMMAFNLVIGQVTPPVGVNLYLCAAISKLRVEQVIGWVMKFTLVLLGVLLVITYFPPLTMVLVG